MPQKRHRDSVEFIGETYHPPGPSAHPFEPADSSRRPLFPSLKAARTSLFPTGRGATIERPPTPAQTPAPDRIQANPSTTQSAPPTDPQPTSLYFEPDFSSAIASALSTTDYAPLATLLATHSIATPQITLIHYHRATTPEFASRLDAAITEVENHTAVQTRREEVMAWRREHERQMHFDAWGRWQVEFFERRRLMKEARIQLEDAEIRERERGGDEEGRGRESGEGAIRWNRERWERNHQRA